MTSPSDYDYGKDALDERNLSLLLSPNATTTVTNSTTHSGAVKNYYAFFLLIIPFLTICGNILVVLSILREKSLQTVTNYFIFSLAVADFLVALVVMPFAVYVEVSKQ